MRTRRPLAHRSPLQRDGMTLLEVLLATAIFLLAVAAITQLFDFATKQATDIEFDSRAARLAQSKMAEYVSGVMSVSSDGSASGTFAEDEEKDWNWQATVQAQSSQNLYLVTITVSQDNAVKGHIEKSLTQFVFDPAMKGYIMPAQTVSAATAAANASGSTTSTATTASAATTTSGAAGGGSMSGQAASGGKAGGATGGGKAGGGSMGGSTTGGSKGGGSTGGAMGGAGGKGG